MSTEEIVMFDLNEAKKEMDTFITAPQTLDSISAAASICLEALRSGKKIISCGNGGSLCDATHFAEELTGRYRGNRESLPAIAINDPAYITCTGNDFSFDDIFARYVEGLGKNGDVLLGISTSGTSSNVLKAAKAAKAKGMKVISLTGPAGNPLAELADAAVCAPAAPHSDRIQEIHIKVIHILIHAIENGMQC